LTVSDEDCHEDIRVSGLKSPG